MGSGDSFICPSAMREGRRRLQVLVARYPGAAEAPMLFASAIHTPVEVVHEPYSSDTPFPAVVHRRLPVGLSTTPGQHRPHPQHECKRAPRSPLDTLTCLIRSWLIHRCDLLKADENRSGRGKTASMSG